MILLFFYINDKDDIKYIIEDSILAYENIFEHIYQLQNNKYSIGFMGVYELNPFVLYDFIDKLNKNKVFLMMNNINKYISMIEEEFDGRFIKFDDINNVINDTNKLVLLLHLYDYELRRYMVDLFRKHRILFKNKPLMTYLTKQAEMLN